jgi:vacuolar-type H+-ATPase subunit H
VKRDGLSREARRNQLRIAAEKKAAEDLLKAQIAAEKERQRVLDETRAKADKINSTIAGTAQSAAGQMVKAYQEGNLTVGKSFEILGKAIFKSLVKSVGEALIQSGAADIFTGMANLLNPVLAPSAPGFFASGGFKSAAGGTIVGVAEAALADGGYVNKPTIALLGEDGPEKVTPLSGGHPMDSGGGMNLGGVTMNINGVKDAREVLTPGRVKAMGHQLLTELDAQRRRQGIRTKRGG